MSQQRLIYILGILFILHIVIALLSVSLPSSFNPSKFTRFYNVYVVPGPFFSANRVVGSDHLLVSWKSDHMWTEPVDLIKMDYRQYYNSWNPRHLYNARLKQTLMRRLNYWDENKSVGKHKRELDNTFSYIRSTVAPASDSLRIWIVRKNAKSGLTTWDTLAIYSGK